MTLRIKANISLVYKEDTTYRHCTSRESESQEHMEICGSRQIEQCGLDADTFKGKVIFWRRMAPILRKLDDTDKLNAFK